MLQKYLVTNPLGYRNVDFYDRRKNGRRKQDIDYGRRKRKRFENVEL